jgi:hypothetical protein
MDTGKDGKAADSISEEEKQILEVFHKLSLKSEKM